MAIKKFWRNISKNKVTVIVNVNVCENTETNQNVSVDVEVEMNKVELIDAIAASAKLTKADAGIIDAISMGAKLTKADAGRALDTTIESTIKLRTFKAIEPEP